MLSCLAGRFVQSALILFGVSLVTFVLLFVMPADPARQIAGRSATPAVVESIRKELGLDQPLYRRYLDYAGRLVRGDLGRSYLQRSEVSALIASRLPATLLLMLGAIACELAIGLTVGLVAAAWRGRRLDRLLMILSVASVSAPPFVVGIALLYVFGLYLGWLPIGGYGRFSSLVLPSLTLGIVGAGWYARMVTSNLLEVLREDYVRTAYAKGLAPVTVLMRHALPNALLPVVAMIGIDIGYFMGGIVVVESIFGWPGIGQLAWQSIQRVDIPVILGVTLVSACAILIGNLVADLLAPIIDPRIRIR